MTEMPDNILHLPKYQVLGIPASTLSHHLARMAKVGLIRQEKHSRTIVCIPEYGHLENLIGFLQEECCAGVRIAHEPEPL